MEQKDKTATILVTGASGFIGSFIVEKALDLGMEVWAAVRNTSSRRYLTDSRINFIQLDFSDYDALLNSFRGMKFDYIVHAAGTTKCLHVSDFFDTNTKGTTNLARAVVDSGMPLRKFLFISSLSVYGAIHEKMPYKNITGSDTPRPNTKYAQSKLEAEKALADIAGKNPGRLPYVILQPTGVYGPRERDYFMMAQSIKRHVDFAAGFKRQDITFIYVKDLVQAVFLALWNGVNGEKYMLSDGDVYQSSAFSDLIRKELGNPWVVRITSPIWLLWLITFVSEILSHVTGKVSALNHDKFHILKQRNWRSDITKARNELGYTPEYSLERGVRETISWYKANNWL